MEQVGQALHQNLSEAILMHHLRFFTKATANNTKQQSNVSACWLVNRNITVNVNGFLNITTSESGKTHLSGLEIQCNCKVGETLDNSAKKIHIKCLRVCCHAYTVLKSVFDPRLDPSLPETETEAGPDAESWTWT